MSKEPIRIAHVIGKWVGGGVEAVVMNYYRNIDHSKIQFDFIFDNDSINIPYEEIESLGGKVILIPPYQKLLKYQKELIKIFKENNYKIVHSHINTLSVFPLRAAKRAGIPVRIAHSHSTTNKKEWKKNILKQVLRPFSKVFATDYMACTEHAGRWLFGNKEFEKGNVYVLNNAIDLSLYKFNKKVREELRRELQIPDNKFVIGHIGRFVDQKNHTFIIDIFNEVHKSNKDTLLMLVGQGPLMEEIREKVNSLNLNDDVIFLGQREDANKLYQAFDLFLFPSLYEGLGMVAIEAQCAGLPCLCSIEVPQVAKVTNNVEFLGLEEDLNNWNDLTLKLIKENNRRDYSKEVSNKGYNIKEEVKKLENEYLEYIQNNEVIELMGLPAVGKSYFSSKLPNYINLNKIYLYNSQRIIRLYKKLILLTKMLLLHPIQFYKCWKFNNFVKYKTNKLKIKMFVYLVSSVYLHIKSEKMKGKVLVEEGLQQALWAICYNNQNNDYEGIIDVFFKEFNFYFCTKIIYLTTKNDILESRLKERNEIGGSELEHDIKKNRRCLDEAVKIMELIKNKIKNTNKIEFIERS